jgi:hypothetical protein
VTSYTEIPQLEEHLKIPVTPALLPELAAIVTADPHAAAAAAAPPAAPARLDRSAAFAKANCPSQTRVLALPPAPASRPPVTYKNITENGDLSDVEVLKLLVEVITRPSLAYRFFARMEVAKVYNPNFCVINDATSGDVGELALVYRFFSATEYIAAADAMKEELPAYKARIVQIHPLAERLDEDGKGAFDL